MIGSSAAFLIMLNHPKKLHWAGIYFNFKFLVKKWCRSHKRTLTCFRSHFVQEKQLTTILSNIHQLTTFPTSLIMISKLYPPQHTHTHNKQLQVTQHCWRIEKRWNGCPSPTPHPPQKTCSSWEKDQQDGSYTLYWEQEVRHHGVWGKSAQTQIHSTDLSRKCAYVNIVILAPNPNHQCHHTDQGKTWKS